MSELASLKASQKTELRNNCSENFADKLCRETSLIQSSLAQGFETGLNQAKADPTGTIARVAVAAATGFMLTKFEQGPLLVAGLTRAAGIGLTASSVFDLADSGKLSKIGSALGDAWASPHNLEADSQVLKENLGRFAFDSMLLFAAGGAGTASATGWQRYRLLHAESPSHPPFEGEITYKFGNGITYNVSPLAAKLNSGTLWLDRGGGPTTPTFKSITAGDGTQVTRFSNGDKLVMVPNVKSILEVGEPGMKTSQLRYEKPGLTITEQQFAGKFNQRHIGYKDWLGIDESGDGSLFVSSNGNPRLSVHRDGGVTKASDMSTWNDDFAKFFPRLPSRPRLKDLADGNHLAQFSNGAKLHMSADGTARLQSRDRIYDIPSELPGDKISRAEWAYFIKHGEPMPKKPPDEDSLMIIDWPDHEL